MKKLIDRLKESFKKFKWFLSLWDGVWSIPIGIMLFTGAGIIIQIFFTDPTVGDGAPGFFDPSYIQLAFYVSLIMTFINFTVALGMYFNFRGLFRYFFGRKLKKPSTKYGDDPVLFHSRLKEGDVFNRSRLDFISLTPIQRICLYLIVYMFFSLVFVLLFLALSGSL